MAVRRTSTPATPKSRWHACSVAGSLTSRCEAQSEVVVESNLMLYRSPREVPRPPSRIWIVAIMCYWGFGWFMEGKWGFLLLIQSQAARGYIIARFAPASGV